MAEQDFVVKKGLEVKSGDITLTAGNLDLNNGYADIDNIKIDGNTIISTDTDGHINLTPNGSGEVNISKVDIDSGAIDNTIIGASTAAAGTFVSVTLDQVAPRSSAMQHKVGNNVANAFEIIQGSDSYMKAVTTTGSESIILSPEPNGSTECQVVIGDGGAEDTNLVFHGDEEVWRLGIDDSADTFQIGVGDSHVAVNATGVAIAINTAGEITRLGSQNSPTSGHFLKWDGSKAIWAAGASGADGMGSGFVLEDGDGTEVTIDEDKEVKFIDGDGIEINWTDVSTGSDGDPYDLTFSLDIDGMTDIGAGVVSGDLLIIDDGANGTNRKTTVDRIATAFAGDGLTASGASLTVNSDQSGQITAVGTLSSLTVSGAADLNNNLTVDGATISLDATTSLNIDNSNTSNGISIGTATSGVPITIGHGTSEVTFGDNVTITGNLTVSGDQTVINSTAIVAEDKSMVLGIAGGMEDATYARSSAVVTVTSTSHGFSNGEYVYVSNMGNSIADGVYTVSSVATNTFVLDSHGTSGTVGAGATMQHSSANVTEATADGSGIYAPGTSLHAIEYDSSNGWSVTDDLDIASGKKLSIGGADVIDNATTITNTVTSAAGLATVGNLNAGTITTGFGAIDNGTSNITTGGLFSIDVDTAVTPASDATGIGAAGSITLGVGADAGLYVSGDNLYIENKTTDKDIIFRVSDNGTYTTVATVDGDVSLFNIATGKLGIGGTAVSSTATELNLVDGSSAGSIVNSKAVVYSSAGQVNGTTLGVNSVSVMEVNSSNSAASSSGAAITVFSMDKTVYRAAKIVLSVELLTTGAASASKYEMVEILVHYDGSNSHHTTYGYMSTNTTDLATITTSVSGDNVLVKYDPVGSDTDNFKFRAVATQLVL